MKRGKDALKRLVLETLGWLLVVSGIAALVLPGPGLLMVFGGLVLLSQQYEWAERRLHPVERRAIRGAAESVQTWPRIAATATGIVWITAVGVLWLLSPPAPDWWPVDDRWWLAGGWPTGVTMVVSGVIALALLVYSFRKFRGVEDLEALLARTSGDS